MTKNVGSALVTVILLLSFLIIVATQVLRSTIFAQDSVLARQKYEQEYQSLRGIMNYALALSKENFDILLRNTDEKLYTLHNWPDGKGAILIQSDKSKLSIRVTKVHKKNDHALQCILYKKDGHFFIDNWNHT